MVQIIMMVEEQSTKGKLLKQAEQLKVMIHDWIPKRKNSVHTLRVLADKLMVHHNNVCIAKVTGSSTAVAGFVLAAVGFGLSFATFGTSLILSGVGSGVGAVGGVTSTGSMFVEDWIREDTFDAAQKIFDDDREAQGAIKKLLEELNEAQNSKIKNGVKAGFTSAFIVKNCVETGLKFGARIASTAASEGGEALFRSLGVAGKVFHIGGFAFSAVLLPVDIYTLVTSSMEIDASRKGKKDKEPKAVKKLRELADEFERDMPNENDFIRELDDFISKAC